MFTNDSYALLIGVDDYSAFDASRGQAKGTSDLHGSANDARAFWRLCRRIGIKPANIRMLVSPVVDLHELEGATAKNVAPATRAEILEKAAWLADRLAQPGHATGLFTYSGHGDWEAGRGLVLCPSDVTEGISSGDELAHAISFAELNAVLAARADNLTVVLDTCHSGLAAADPTESARALSLRRRSLGEHPALGPAGVHALEGLVGRVMCAARRDQVAYQALFDGQFRGVFSWALGTAIDQWRATPEGRNVCLDLTYDRLLETAERLLAALWFKQTPQLHGPRGVERMAVLQQEQAPRPVAISRIPDAPRKTEEVDPGTRNYILYTITDVNANQLAQVLVTGATAYGVYAANTEYWFITTNLTNGESVTFTSGGSQYWASLPTLGAYSFSMPTVTTWTQGNYRGTMPNYAPGTGELDGMIWQMSNSTGSWHGSITWWSNQGSRLLFTSGSSWALTNSHVVLSNYYYITQTI